MLREMYKGKIIPYERRNRLAAEQLEIAQKIDAEEKYFAEKLPPDDCERFLALSNLYSMLSTSDESEIFAYGFSVGMLLMVDVMKEAKIVLPDD